MMNNYDVIIVGGGIAGMTAAIYTTRGGAKTLIIEKESLGGQLNSAPLIENYPGFAPMPGAEISNKISEQLDNFEIPVVYDTVTAVGRGWKRLVVETDNDYYVASAIIIATGAKYKELPYSASYEMMSYCPTCDGAFYKGQKVAVIGDGNSALQYAISLSAICKEVVICTLTDKFFGEQKVVERVMSLPNVKHLPNVITNGYNDGKLSFVSGESIEVDGIFVAIGQEPSTEFLPSSLKERDGHIINVDCQTAIQGIFTAGDCRTKKAPSQAITNASDGIQAAMLALEYLKTKAKN